MPGGGVPKWLRGRSAKPLRIGSNPIAASKSLCDLALSWSFVLSEALETSGSLASGGAAESRQGPGSRMLRSLSLSSLRSMAPKTIGGLWCLAEPAVEVLSLRVLCRDGEIGRRAGLKIPWANRPCGFEPRSRHLVTYG